MEWVEGTPSEKGAYWVVLEDQGGWPSVALLIVRKVLRPELEEGASPAQLADLSLKAASGERFSERTLVLSYSLPERGGEPAPLSSLWNCSSYVKIPKPKVP